MKYYIYNKKEWIENPDKKPILDNLVKITNDTSSDNLSNVEKDPLEENLSNVDKVKLQNDLSGIAAEIQQKLSHVFDREIITHWTRKDTFCFIFSEYDITGKQWVLGTGEMFFAKLVRKKYYCILLSNNMEDNFKEFNIDGKIGIRINSKNYSEFVSKFKKSNDLVSTFLYDFESPIMAKVVRNWIRGFETPGVVTVPIVEWKKIIDCLPYEQIFSLEKLEDFSSILKNTSKGIIENHVFFDDQLKIFLRYIENDTTEKQLQNFLLENLWLLNFKYFGYDKPTKEEKTDVGNMDIFATKNSFGSNHVSIIELKRADKPLTTISDRGIKKPNLRSEVIRALSQAIHYIENTPREPYSTIEGFVIIGIRDEQSSKILDALNSRLHGIQVLTYDDLYNNTKMILDSFKTRRKPK